MVLTQQVFSVFNTGFFYEFPYHYGSYATCWVQCIIRNNSYRFHTTMVLTQPSVLFLPELSQYRFHTTMVLTQLSWVRGSGTVWPRFPYHYGSYATQQEKALQERNRSLVSIPLWFLRNRYFTGCLAFSVPVSIPLWFLRNTLKSIRLIQMFISFHTTMVLTQQLYEQRFL